MALMIGFTKCEAGMYRIKLAGSLDTETSGQLNREFEKVWDEDPAARLIRLEIHDLVYISSIGLGLLAKMKKLATQRGGSMITVGAQPQIARVFDIVKMLPKETVFLSHKEADEYLAAIEKKVIEGGKGA